MKELKLKNSDNVVAIDDEDFDRLSLYTWYTNATGSIYRYFLTAPNKYTGRRLCIVVPLAAEVMCKTDVMFDHIDRDASNNQKNNLRECTYSQNNANKAKGKNCSSSYKGVSLRKKSSPWEVCISLNRKYIYIGTFKTEIEAAKAYDKKALELYGEFAVLNFPDSK